MKKQTIIDRESAIANLSVLETFFASAELPAGSLQFTAGQCIVDIPKFISVNIALMRSISNRQRFADWLFVLPYDRLSMLKNNFLQTQK